MMDIITLPIENDKKRIESRYRLVVIASQRARELSVGALPLIQAKAKKVTTTSLLETMEGSFEFLTDEEAIIAREHADKIDYKKLMEEKRKPMEDLSELEKDVKVYLHEKSADDLGIDEIFGDGDDLDDSE